MASRSARGCHTASPISADGWGRPPVCDLVFLADSLSIDLERGLATELERHLPAMNMMRWHQTFASAYLEADEQKTSA